MTKQLLAVLREGFEGPEGSRSHYLDSGPESGLRRTLAGLSPDDASREWGGNSVAAHAQHLLFSFEAFGAYIAGDHAQRDWDESWSVSEVDAASWKKLQADLAEGFAALHKTMEEHAEKSKAATSGSLAAITHLAYHVGAIRQKIAAMRTAAA